MTLKYRVLKAIQNVSILVFVLFSGFIFVNTEAKAQVSSYSIRFNGTTSTRVSVPVSQGSINVGAGDFTIEWWMKPVTASGSACSGGNDVFTNGGLIIDRDIFGPGDFGDFGISFMGDRRVAFSVNNGSSGVTACSSALTLNQWYYMAVVKQGTNIRIYVNGALSNSVIYSGQTNLSYNTSRSTSYVADPYFVFGAEKHTSIGGESFTAYHYNGFLDEVRFSNIARSIAPRSTPFTADGNTVALFAFENSSNSSVGGISGTRVGATYSTDVAFSAPVTTVPPTATPTTNPTSNPTTNPTSSPTANPTTKPSTTTNPSTSTTPSVSVSPSDTSSPTPSIEVSNTEETNQTSTPTPTQSSKVNSTNPLAIGLGIVLCLGLILILIIVIYFLYKKGKIFNRRKAS